jgi:serine/threonine-protein kinase
MAIEPGGVLAGYRVERLLARGGMGEVYLAQHPFLARWTALKVLRPEYAEDDNFRERFLREANQAAALKHPHIVTIYDAGEFEGHLFLAMEYAPGGDLRQLLQREGRIAPARAAMLIGQVAGALDAAHQRGLVHRDVKPGNILLRPPEPPQQLESASLADFGLARLDSATRGLTATGQVMGTVSYVAPEVVRGAAAGAPADVYALGCVLAECLLGTPPFARPTDVGVLNAHLSDPPPLVSRVIPGVSPAFDAVIARALAKQPEHRYATCGEMAEDALRAAAAPAPLPGPVPPPVPAPLPPQPTPPPAPAPGPTMPMPSPYPGTPPYGTDPTMPVPVPAPWPGGPPAPQPGPGGPWGGGPGPGAPWPGQGGPGGPGGPGGYRQRTSSAWLPWAVGAVILLLLGVGAFVLLSGRGSKKPNPDPTASVTTTITTPPTTPFTTPPTTPFTTPFTTPTSSISGFNTAERALLSHVPTAWSDTCRSDRGYVGGTGMTAHLTCRPTSTINMFYDQYDSIGNATAQFTSLSRGVPSGACGTTYPATGTYSRSGTTAGRITCRTNTGGFKEILWTNNATAILANAFSRTDTPETVFKFWQDSGGPY